MTKRKDIEIFLAFFILYLFFIHWAGWYENSIFAMIRAIVDEKRFEIDSYANQTSDRAYFNGHYYSEKSPMSAIFGTPVYASWKLIYNSLFPQNFKTAYSGSNRYLVRWSKNNTSIIEYINPGFFILNSMILITVFIPCLFSTLTVLLVYKISKFFTKNERHRIFIVIAAGLGSLIFPYALNLNTPAIGTFFAFFSFYIMFNLGMTKKKKKEKSHLLLSGVLLGLAVLSDYSTTPLAGLIFFYQITKFEMSKIKNFILGCFIGILPFLIYNYAILGYPFEALQKYMDREVFTTVPEKVLNSYGFLIPNLGVTYQILFGSYRGLFYYYPIYFLLVLGIPHMTKKFKKEAILILLIFIFYLIFNSSRITWHGGYTFGPRYMYYLTPFTMIPVLFAFKYLEDKIHKIATILLLIGTISLLIFSIFSNLLSLQIMEDSILDRDTLLVSKTYNDKINLFQSLPDPLFNHYLPLFLKYGPRSMIFENLYGGHIDIDIRDIPFSRGWSYPYIAENHLPFASLTPFVIVLLLVL